MKGAQIVLDRLAGRAAAALVIDGRLEDFLLADAEDAGPAPGAIYRAVTDRPLKGQGGMICTLPDGTKALFRGAKGLRQGEALLVQVTSYTDGQKAAPVTDRLIFKGRYVIVTPGAPGLNISRRIKDEEARVALHDAITESALAGSGFGAIIRSQAAGADPAEIVAEADTLTALALQVTGDTGTGPELLLDAPDPQELVWREWPKTTPVEGFEAHGVLDLLEALSVPRVRIEGGHAMIEPTSALVAVDVNTGGDFSPAAGLKANIALARELPRQLRLRGLGGQITIDPAPMPKKDRRQFEQVLRAAFRSDPVETALVGWTPLGHFELQRKRERRPLDLPQGVL